jgi:hypothetical protein
MVHQGRSEMEYRAWPDFDDAVHGISDSSTVFPAEWEEDRAIRQVFWWYVPAQDAYYTREENQHQWIVAAKTLFTASRFEEISDTLEEHGAWDKSVERLKGKKCRKIIQKATDRGLITTAERDQLFTVFPDN